MASNAKSQPVYSAQGRVVGLIKNGWLEKRVEPSRHQLRHPPAWATDEAHLSLPGLKGIRLRTPTGGIWEAEVFTFRRFGVPIERGFGRQIALPLRYWRCRASPGVRQLPLWESGEVAP